MWVFLSRCQDVTDSWPLDAVVVAGGQNAGSFAVCLILTPPVKASEDASVQPKSEPTLILTHKGINKPPPRPFVTLTAAQMWNFLMPDFRRQTDVLLFLFFCAHVKANNFFPASFCFLLEARWFFNCIFKESGLFMLLQRVGGGAQHNTFTFRQRLSVSRGFRRRTDVWFTAVWKEPKQLSNSLEAVV